MNNKICEKRSHVEDKWGASDKGQHQDPRNMSEVMMSVPGFVKLSAEWNCMNDHSQNYVQQQNHPATLSIIRYNKWLFLNS